MAPQAALIWKYYDSKDEDGKRKCKLCDHKEDNSSNAEKHLSRHHAEEFKKFETEKAKSPSRKRHFESAQVNTLEKSWKSKSKEE